MHDEWTSRFSALLDHELAPAERAQVEAHLAECVPCRQVLADLRAVQAWAPEYRGLEPAPGTWVAIAGEIDRTKSASIAAPVPRRYTLGQLAAAVALMAVLAGGGMWVLLRPGGAAAPAVTVAPAPIEVLAAAIPVGSDPAWDAAVAELEQALTAGRGQLDTATVRIIEANLTVIDSAIAEARAAIAADPSNVHLAARIRSNMQRKLDLLRHAARAAGAAS